MSILFADAYPDTAEGRATEALAGVATTVEQYLGSRIDDETRLGCLIELHRIEGEHLPEELLSLFDELRSYFGIA
jgi:hypothetical protein